MKVDKKFSVALQIIFSKGHPLTLRKSTKNKDFYNA